MVRGNDSANAETDVKATARQKTIRITMRRGSPREALKNDLSTTTIRIFRLTCHAQSKER